MSMLPKPAQYLLRVDDLCPTVHRENWERLVGMIREFQISPILAVVPDNQDPELCSSPADPDFWAQMRELEAAGAAIAIHGYRHVCSSTGRSMIPLHRCSEFAGLPLGLQRIRLHLGLEILRGNGLHPCLWVAPRHGFDRNTIAALRDEGIGFISDGFARRAFLRDGVVWIPQQIWAPVSRAQGLWTICLHPDGLTAEGFDELRTFLTQYGSQFTSFQRVVAELPQLELGFGERLHEKFAMWSLRLRRGRKKLFAMGRSADQTA